MKNSYSYLWEFQVDPGMEAAFEAHYGPTGTWARLFRLSPDYIETLLLKDNAAPGRYLTLDRWRSEEGYQAFRSAHATQYAQLDKECARLTAAERSLGAFGELPRDSSSRPTPRHGPA